MEKINRWENAWDDTAKAKGTHDYAFDLKAAVDTFRDIAGGRQVDVLKLDAGALALHVLSRQSSDPDLIDAALNLKIIATAGRIDICEEGRERAAYLASVVDKFRRFLDEDHKTGQSRLQLKGSNGNEISSMVANFKIKL